MNIIEELEEMRKRVIRNINSEFDLLIERAKSETIQPPDPNDKKSYDCTYPLVVGPAVFKGKKPISLVFGNGRKVKILTWKQLAEEVLKDCISYPDKKQGLIELCDNVSGRKRFFLSKSNEDMRSPIEIEKGIYMETHYDTETLLRILITRILDVVNYDYSGISVVIRND